MALLKRSDLAARALLVLLALATASCRPDMRVRVRSSVELLELLRQLPQSGGEVEGALAGDVALAPSDVQPFEQYLPFRLAPNSTLILGSEGLSVPPTLDLGRIAQQLLWLESGAHLWLRDLHIKGIASPIHFTNLPPTEDYKALLWPQVAGADGHQMTFERIAAERTTRNGCAVEAAAANVSNLIDASNSTVVQQGRTLSNVGTLEIPTPILDTATQEQVGLAHLTFINTSVTCLEDLTPNEVSSAQSPALQPGLGAAPPAPPGSTLPALDLRRGASGSSGAAAGAQPVAVRTGAGLLAALNHTRAGLIALEDDVRIAPTDAARYQLPFVVAANTSLLIASDDGSTRTLDCGALLQLLYLESSSTLLLQDLNLTGIAPAWREEKGLLPDEIVASFLWPTISGAAGHQVVAENCTLDTEVASCGPEMAQALASPFTALLGDDDSVVIDGTSVSVQDSITLTFSVINSTSGRPVGTTDYHFSHFTASCYNSTGPHDAADSAGIPAVGGSSSSSSWAWAVAASVAAAAVALAAAAALLVRRRRQRRRQKLLLDKAGGAAAGKDSSTHSSASGVSAYLQQCRVVVVEAAAAPPECAPENLGRSSPESREAELAAAMWLTRVGPIQGLELGDLLGRGSFGRAYKGRWNGSAVAVKIIEQSVEAGKPNSLSREPLISMAVRHPSVVSCYKVCVLRLGSGTPSPVTSPDNSGLLDAALADSLASLRPRHSPVGDGGSPTAAPQPPTPFASASDPGNQAPCPLGDLVAVAEPAPSCEVQQEEGQAVGVMSPYHELQPGEYEVWLVLEYCDRGNLADALRTGRFRNQANGEMDLPAVLLTLLDIARAVEYLHSIDMIHGDLKGRNVLLKSVRKDRRGFECKVADFGLSRMLHKHQTHISTASYGTATHAAPELLENSLLTKAADIYAMGIIMWEAVAGEEAHEGLTSIQVMVQVLQHGLRPEIPPHYPAPLAGLMQRCWQQDARLRPTAAEVATELNGMFKSLRGVPSQSRSEPMASTGAIQELVV